MTRDPNGGRLVGADLGDFIVGEFLSSGGQASVHRGRFKPPIDAPVAIKFLHPLYAADPDNVARRLTLPVPDDISDGRYTFYCTLCRFPE